MITGVSVVLPFKNDYVIITRFIMSKNIALIEPDAVKRIIANKGNFDEFL